MHSPPTTPAEELDRSAHTWDPALLVVEGDAMAEPQGALFDERFLERHAGEIIRDPEIAIVELVANAWDAWATRVDVRWAERGNEQVFSITDRQWQGNVEGAVRAPVADFGLQQTDRGGRDGGPASRAEGIRASPVLRPQRQGASRGIPLWRPFRTSQTRARAGRRVPASRPSLSMPTTRRSAAKGSSPI